MKRLLLTLLLLLASSVWAQAPTTPKAQMCITASIVVEDMAKAMSKSQVEEARNIVTRSALPGAQTQKLSGLITLWSRQDPKSFTPQYGQQLSQQYYLDCMARK